MNVPRYPRENGCRGILLGLVILGCIVGLAVAMWFSNVRASNYEFIEKKHAQDNAAIEAVLNYQEERQQ